MLAIVITIFLSSGLLAVAGQASAAEVLNNTAKNGSASSRAAITDAWARATVPAQPVGAAYMKISSPVSLTLVGIESDIAKEVQVHNMHTHNGVMQMRKHEQLVIPAGNALELAPGGMHLMLLGLKKQLKAGESISLKFTFRDEAGKQASTIATVPVRPIGQ